MSQIHEDCVDGGMIADYIEDNPPLTDGFCAMAEKNFPDDAFLILPHRHDVAPIDRNASSPLVINRRLIDMAKQPGVDFLST